MRILFLSLTLPYPADNGQKMRSFSLLRALHEEGHKIDLMTFAQPDDLSRASGALSKICAEIITVPQKTAGLSASANYLGRLRALLLNRPFTVDRFRSKAMKDKISQQLERKQFDAVFCDATHAMVNLPADSPPIVLNNHNVEYLIVERFAARETNPIKRLYASFEARKLQKWEERSCQRAEVGMACSEHDRQLFSTLCPQMPTFVVPNTVDVDSYQPADVPEPLTLVYQGGMDWYPNRDAVEFFVGSILPKLRSCVPGVRFVVAGRNPPPEFLARFSKMPDVEFTGTVADMRPIIQRAAVCVVPLRIGSGTRLKILEAAAMGKPIVSTNLGAEGLDFLPGVEIILASTSEAFSQEVVSLLTDPSRCAQLGKAARKKVEEKYAFRSLLLALQNSLAALQHIQEQVPVMAE